MSAEVYCVRGWFVPFDNRLGSMSGLDLDKSLDISPASTKLSFPSGILDANPATRGCHPSIRIPKSDGGCPEVFSTRITGLTCCMQPSADTQYGCLIWSSTRQALPIQGGEPWQNAMPLITGLGNLNHSTKTRVLVSCLCHSAVATHWFVPYRVAMG